MGQTFTARQTARDIVTALGKRGITRDVDAKRVRAWVRDNVDAYDDDGYTAHLYDARTHDRIVSSMVARYSGTRGTDGRANAASVGRGANGKATAAKARAERRVSNSKAQPIEKTGTPPTA
jgi:hypothetical protein